MLSVIIVNYNTQYFIQVCLHAVLNAMRKVPGEVIVVDNASDDDSCNIIANRFPQVTLIKNTRNLGFAKANNLGIAHAKGDYVLLLNPDTIVPEDCFEKSLGYLENNRQVGALGARMIDGSGCFLPESKRGLPTPKTAFFKMSGLYKLRPKSEKLGKYYHEHLPEHEINQVEVLTGAFFMARKKVGDQLGWLDEHYFMYGEDIDLSYCFTRSGHPLVYFPETSIVHFKGESSKDLDKKYLKSFFGAMELFYNKHFQQTYGSLFKYLILAGIRIKSGLSLLQQLFYVTSKKNKVEVPHSFILLAKHNQTIESFQSIVGERKFKVFNVSEKDALLKQTGAQAVVFTPDYSYKSQLHIMQTCAGKAMLHQYFFMSPQKDFILGSSSKKWNGIILHKSNANDKNN